MSTGALDWAFNLTGLTPSQKSVLIALANYADEAGSCYPSVRRIGEMTALKARAIQYAIRELEELGYVRSEGRLREGRASHTSNRYFIVKNPARGGASNAPGGGASDAPGVVHVVHQGGASGAPLEPKKNQLSTDVESARSKKIRTALPTGWAPTEEHAAYCLEQGIDLAREVEAFQLDASAHGRRYIEWNSAFAKWIRSPHPHVMLPSGPPKRSLRDRYADARVLE